MHAQDIMRTIETCLDSDSVEAALNIMIKNKVSFVPVVDDNNILGVVNSLDIINKIVPKYIVEGYLEAVPYAPDIGALANGYTKIKTTTVGSLIDNKPTIVRGSDSLLSIAAAIITFDRYEYVLVSDQSKKKLLGIITTEDILQYLATHGKSDA